jgi:porin
MRWRWVAILLDDRLDIRVGRIGAGDDFLTSPLYTAFVNPVRWQRAACRWYPSFSVYPVATWGLRTRSCPSSSWSVMTGLYYSDPTLARNSAHGIDFSIRARRVSS